MAGAVRNQSLVVPCPICCRTMVGLMQVRPVVTKVDGEQVFVRLAIVDVTVPEHECSGDAKVLDGVCEACDGEGAIVLMVTKQIDWVNGMNGGSEPWAVKEQFPCAACGRTGRRRD